MRVLFLGSNSESSTVINDYMLEHKYYMKYSNHISTKSGLVNKARQGQASDVMILDLSDIFGFDAEEVSEAIREVKQFYKGEFIGYLQGGNVLEPLINACKKEGCKYFIFGVLTSDVEEELDDIFSKINASVKKRPETKLYQPNEGISTSNVGYEEKPTPTVTQSVRKVPEPISNEEIPEEPEEYVPMQEVPKPQVRVSAPTEELKEPQEQQKPQEAPPVPKPLMPSPEPYKDNTKTATTAVEPVQYSNPTNIQSAAQQPAVFNPQIIHKRNTNVNNNNFDVPEKTIRIGVIGIINRIGTTTQALAINRFLTDNGFKSCYIQGNVNSVFIDYLVDYYDGVEVGENGVGCITYNGINLFRSLSSVYSKNYNYEVFDYGYVQDAVPTDFYENDIKIVVCGSTAEEAGKLTEYASSFDAPDINFIFSFTSPMEHKDICEMMASHKTKTYFSPYIADGFEMQDTNTQMFYSQVLNIKPSTPAETEKKTGFFRKRKR